MTYVEDLAQIMMEELDFQSNKSRINDILRNEIIPKLEVIAGPITKECIQLLVANSKLRVVVKDQFIEMGGTFNDGSLYYLYSGLARSCYYSPNIERPFISRIWKMHEVIFDVNSFLKGKNRTEAIQMLADGELISVNYTGLQILIDSFPKMLSVLLFVQAENEKYNNFYQHILKLTVDQRVRLYLDNNPDIRDRVTKECIAMHLGISRSKFSSAYALYKADNSSPG